MISDNKGNTKTIYVWDSKNWCYTNDLEEHIKKLGSGHKAVEIPKDMSEEGVYAYLAKMGY